MGLIDDARAEVRKPGSPCPIRAVTTKLPDDEQAELARFFAGEIPLPDSAFTRALRSRGAAHGIRIGDDAVRKHRDGTCACGPR